MTRQIRLLMTVVVVVFAVPVWGQQALDDLFDTGGAEQAARPQAEIAPQTDDVDPEAKPNQGDVKPGLPDGQGDPEKLKKKEDKELSVKEKFEEFAKGIEKELERRELEGTKGLKTLRKIQDEQRQIYRDANEELRVLLAKKRTKETRAAMKAALKRKRLAGARLNALEEFGNILIVGSNGFNRNDDLMNQVNRYSRNLTPKERSEWQRDPEIQRRYSKLMQTVMASRNRHYHGANEYTDLTDGLVETEYEIDTPRYPDHPGAEEGTLADSRPALTRILRLSWVGDRVAIDKDHWDSFFAGKSTEEISQDVHAILRKHHVELPKTNQHGMSISRMQYPHNLLRLFDGLRSRFSTSGRSYGGSSNTFQSSFQAVEANAQLNVRPDSFRFEFRERTEPYRLLMIEQNSAGKLRITLYGKVVFRLLQETDGSIEIVETMGTEVLHRKAETLGELYERDPEYIETRLFGLLYHVGILPPASRFDDEVVYRVVDRLRMMMEIDDIEIVNQLIRDLDHDDFRVRQAALKRLEKQADKYRELLIAAATEQDASFEVKSALKYILDKSSIESAEVDAIINSLRLMDDPEYLAIMIQSVDEDDVSPVAKRLNQLTGMSYGEDIDAWRRWLIRMDISADAAETTQKDESSNESVSE